MADSTRPTFFQKLSRKTDAKNEPAKRHAVNERIPEQASATPTSPSGSLRILPCCSIGMPSVSKIKNTTTVTRLSMKRLRLFSTIETIGAETSHTNTGKTNIPASFTRASIINPLRFDGLTTSGAFRINNGKIIAPIPTESASVPGKDAPEPAR